MIVAGGGGTRMGSKIPKQFLEVAGKPVLIHTIKAFQQYDQNIDFILVLPKEQQAYWHKLADHHHLNTRYTLVNGGETRFHSVKNGLGHISAKGLVAIHDGVRPLVSIDTISRCFDEAKNKGNAIPVLPITESVRSVVGTYSRAIDRSNLRLVQTPQVFDTQIIKEAYLQDYQSFFTDDASVIEKIGHEIHTVEGNPENIKITTPLDIKIAELFFREE